MVYNMQLPEEADDTTTEGFKTRVENIADIDDELNDEIRKALEQLTIRDQCSLIQLWSPSTIGKHKVLKTVDQAFVLGTHNQGLCNYRSESECHWFLVDEECKDEDLIPIVRVFRRRLSEWTSDVRNYKLKKHPLQDCAIRWNLHGYLVLPVFDPIAMLCVGVLEIITSSKYLDCAYEVQEVHRTLKKANLTSPQAFDCPASYVNYKNKQHELDEIFKVLKDVCDTHKLPLAQTWTVSSRSSFVATEKNIEMTCNSFNVGKECMSTSGLPFYVQDLRVWQFRKACRKHHLLKSEGVLGRALSSHGSCFCLDVTKLREHEYSLVHHARMSGLTGCYAIYLHSREHDDGYLLEFFLPVDMKEDADLRNLVQMMKTHFKFSSFEFGDAEVIGMHMETSQLSLVIQSDTIQNSSSKEIMQLDPQRVGETNAQIDCMNAQDQCDSCQVSHKNWSITAITNTGGKECKSGQKPVCMKQRTKHTTKASMSLGSLSKERFQQDAGETHQTNAQDQHDFSNNYPKNRSSTITNTEGTFADDATSKRTDIVACPKQRRKRKMGSVTPETIQQYFGKPIGNGFRSLGVSRSTFNLCRELNIAGWTLPHLSKKYAHFGVSVVVLLLVRVKRWICSSNHHGFSVRWWICGKHNAFVSKSNPMAILPIDDIICRPLPTDRFYKPSQARFGVHHLEMVTVKATFKDDMIKFQFPLSSGLSELKNQVAQRTKVKSSRLRLKYMDEDDDLILVCCDTDLRNLMPFSASSTGKSTIKLIVQMSDD